MKIGRRLISACAAASKVLDGLNALKRYILDHRAEIVMQRREHGLPVSGASSS